MREGRRPGANFVAAQKLRRLSTPSETLLWERLRDRRFLGLKFRRQHPVEAFVLDFYCYELNFAIEIDGEVHRRSEQARRDRIRQRLLEEKHIFFYRWTASDVERDVDGLLLALAHDQHLIPPAVESLPLSPTGERGAGG